MTTSCRTWWRNCAQQADSEILNIDMMEDEIVPLAPNIARIRELISSLELCHHKAERWVYNIIEAIGAGETPKGPGRRSPGQQHPAEILRQSSCTALSAWCAGNPSTKVELSIDTVPASQLLSCLGERSPLKEWQVQRVIEKIRAEIHWPQSLDDPSVQYVWIILGGGEYESTYRHECPVRYEEHEDFWLRTVRTFIHDNVSGHEAKFSLGFAIDMLWPCHWNFVENLQIVLAAIGGDLYPEKVFAACSRNITLVPIHQRMGVVSNTLKAFCGNLEPNQEVDRDLLALLGERTEAKEWLAASLEKTIRLQLSLSPEQQTMAALACPDWIT